MIQVTGSITATTASLLAGTDLESIPEDGQLDLVFGSTAVDGTITVRGPANEPIAVAQVIPMKGTTGQPSFADDPTISLPVTQGGKYVLGYVETTAATMQFVALFRSLSELRGR